MIDGLLRIPLRRFEDERGWFAEIRRESLLPKQTRQTNLSFSRKGVLRGLHYHERGQDDLFVCLQGTARVVVLDRESGETFTEDIGDDNPVALYIPGRHAHGFEALTDLFFCYHVTEEYDPADPDEQGICWADPRVKHLWSTRHPAPLGAGPAGVYLVTGAGGQLGRALAEEFAEDGVVALAAVGLGRRAAAPRRPRAARRRPPRGRLDERRRRRGRPAGRGRGQRRRHGERRRPRCAARLLLDRLRLRRIKGEPYVESDGPNPQSAYGRTKLHGEAAAGERAWIVRSSWLFGPTGTNFVRTMLRLGEERDEVAVVDDQRGSPTYVGHLAAATRQVLLLPHGVYHVAAEGDATWADFAEAIFEEAGLDTRVRRITTAELGRPAPRPAYSVLRSEKGAPTLPHWREGLRETIAAIRAGAAAE